MPNPHARALLVVDAQNEYFSGGLPIEYPDPAASLANIGRAMDAAGAASIPVAVVQNTAPAGAPIFAPGTPGWELHPAIAARPRDHWFEKRLPSCYAGTDLRDWIARTDTRTLVVVGYMTHNCVDATVRQAVHEGLAVEVLHDACGSLPYANRAGAASAEEIHRAFMVVMQSRFAAVLSTDEWIALLAGDAKPERDNVYASNQRARQARSG